MGHNDHIEDYRADLPPEAGEQTRQGFEPSFDWLKTADPELAREAMRVWFETRYWDPANNTPYNSREGGYLYIHGGPYDAEEELYRKFGREFSDELIRAVIDDVESDGITEWAPIHTEPDYDDVFQLEANTRSDPYQFFEQRLKEVDALVAAEIDTERQALLRQLLFSYLIAALEAYLADTMSYWVAVDKRVFRNFVSVCEEFKKQKLTLSEIFERMDALDEEVEQYLQQLVWHRLDKIVPLMSGSLQIARPAIDKLMAHVVVRHDIVHRGGRTKDGARVNIDADELSALRKDLVEFVDGVEVALRKRFPIDLSGFADSGDF